jgi:hypothetical protein
MTAVVIVILILGYFIWWSVFRSDSNTRPKPYTTTYISVREWSENLDEEEMDDLEAWDGSSL